jgi:hypothetical protein
LRGELGVDADDLGHEVDPHLAHQRELFGDRLADLGGDGLGVAVEAAQTDEDLLAEVLFVDLEEHVRVAAVVIRLRMRSSIVTPIEGTRPGIEVTTAWKRELTIMLQLRSTLTRSYMS